MRPRRRCSLETRRGGAAAGRVRRAEARRRRGWESPWSQGADADIPRRRVAAPRRGPSSRSRYARCLEKCFLSVKGVYFRAEVHGATVTWLVPHAYTQTVPDKVDFKVMLTFLEFYECLLKFVLFKLHKDAGLAYPPAASEKASTFLDLVSATRIDDQSGVLAGCSVALAREASYGWLDFCAAAAGATVVADAAEATHVVSDRPLADSRDSSKDHVQPQWIVDALNKGRKPPVAPYPRPSGRLARRVLISRRTSRGRHSVSPTLQK